jgi:hypothetical protein
MLFKQTPFFKPCHTPTSIPPPKVGVWKRGMDKVGVKVCISKTPFIKPWFKKRGFAYAYLLSISIRWG